MQRKNTSKVSKAPNAKRGKTKTAVSKKKKPTRKLTRSFLMPFAPGTSVQGKIKVTFISGLGQLTASLFRNGILINMQSVSSSSVIFLSDVQFGDVISVNGVCTGSADISISVSTNPTTPQHFGAGPIHSGYIVT